MWVVDVEGTPMIVDRGGHDVDEVAEYDPVRTTGRLR